MTLLVEEVEKRTSIRWKEAAGWPTPDGPVVVVCLASNLPNAPAYRGLAADFTAPRGAEGYQLRVRARGQQPVVFVVGNDARGLLFGVGRLLRELRLERGSISLGDRLEIATAPAYPLRGHQLGYRPKCNSYDAWDVARWEQYYRDLAVFGCNTVELIPPRSDDDADSPHFPLPPMEMMQHMSRLAGDYGLDVSVWYPAMDRDYSQPATVEAALREWGEVFSKLSRLDALFVPGGDPGHTPPKLLMALLEKQATNLRRYHPHAEVWVSPQGFNQVWLDEFWEILRLEPAWLTGVVYAPQVRISLPQFRKLVPARYPIRHYPDITHTRQCQYPVPDWDTAFAVTEGRECINPRPEGEAAIFRQTQPGTTGFVTYSEGCNDDVNKFVWSALGWDPSANLTDVLRQYSAYFIGASEAAAFADGLAALERNWQGTLATNTAVERTLEHFQVLEKAATPEQLKNWRFQQALFRAYFDAYTRQRLLRETESEKQAMAELRAAPTTGAQAAMSAARKHLRAITTQPVRPEWRAYVYELGDALFQSIGMQLSVQRHKAIGVERGASLDTLDFPLNNRFWLEDRFKTISALPSEAARLKAISGILNWTDPGPGGFYDDLGNPLAQPHLLRGVGMPEDPGCFRTPRVGFAERPYLNTPEGGLASGLRVSWQNHEESLYDQPLQLAYTDLDPQARYRVRVVYAGDSATKPIRLVANDGLEIHPYIARPRPVVPLEFDVPQSATRNGRLTLSWFGELGAGGNGRGCQVAEVWLVRDSSSRQPTK